ncbi:TetR family transcriptional regulator [Stackebrandtia albiflava]|uniref:TetR family transcriptional regulator n=1 Tax=Stackebrandtia albiflava TaxID=406432 RepID=A0A562V181_9ACTN|nr:TetR family transcriptional regulator [Stackebrandtia albiflava]TWJ11669.1 TetR family transcriptional regulator [Stackebrandtia albiflava]
MSTGRNPGLRERTRRAVRAELSRTAMDLFTRHGYEATTVDDIAAAAGISKRSFFRYFPQKEDVVLADVELLGDEVVRGVAARPVDEAPWDSLAAVLGEWAEGILSTTAATRRLRLVEGTPALRARLHTTRDELRRRVATALCDRDGVTLDRFEAELLTAAAAAALDTASHRWSLDPDADLRGLVTRAFEVLRPAAATLE